MSFRHHIQKQIEKAHRNTEASRRLLPDSGVPLYTRENCIKPFPESILLYSSSASLHGREEDLYTETAGRPEDGP
ncbi:UNVERIFIED_CONTAM: hypothetical protein PYX00_002253 [Menopon gallinae]|uniref:Uncharacterized protein n=1 Tax=Menopon gallinae TaxID=328185 RepID=A0AAW2IHP7_9NEOP